MSEIKTITDILITGDIEKLTETVQSALDKGVSASEILSQGLIPGMDIVGEGMEAGEMFIPEVLMSAQAMTAAVQILKPLLGSDEVQSAGKVVIGTVQGDMHDIGKNLVKMMMDSAGFEVVDLGTDVTPEQFVDAISANNADIVALSALLTTTMDIMEKTVKALVEKGLRDKVKIMVGGAPVTQAFADDIGADGYAADAGSACKIAKALLN